MTSREILGKFNSQQKTLGKWLWTNFLLIFFSRKIVDEFSMNIRTIFGSAINDV